MRVGAHWHPLSLWCPMTQVVVASMDRMPLVIHTVSKVDVAKKSILGYHKRSKLRSTYEYLKHTACVGKQMTLSASSKFEYIMHMCKEKKMDC